MLPARAAPMLATSPAQPLHSSPPGHIYILAVQAGLAVWLTNSHTCCFLQEAKRLAWASTHVGKAGPQPLLKQVS